MARISGICVAATRLDTSRNPPPMPKPDRFDYKPPSARHRELRRAAGKAEVA